VDVNRRLGRVVGYFSSFLGLAAMVSLGLAGLAAAFLFREHLRGGLKEIAILLSLGASRRQCLLLSMGQLALLGLAAACVSIALARLLLPLFGRLFTGLIPADLQLILDPIAVLMTLFIGVIGSLSFCLPLYRRLFAVRPLWLLREEIEDAPGQRLASLKNGCRPAAGAGTFPAADPAAEQFAAQGLGFIAGLAIGYDRLFLSSRPNCCLPVAALVANRPSHLENCLAQPLPQPPGCDRRSLWLWARPCCWSILFPRWRKD
jgi:putative ABC transport system permease protein